MIWYRIFFKVIWGLIITLDMYNTVLVSFLLGFQIKVLNPGVDLKCLKQYISNDTYTSLYILMLCFHCVVVVLSLFPFVCLHYYISEIS